MAVEYRHTLSYGYVSNELKPNVIGNAISGDEHHVER